MVVAIGGGKAAGAGSGGGGGCWDVGTGFEVVEGIGWGGRHLGG